MCTSHAFVTQTPKAVRRVHENLLKMDNTWVLQNQLWARGYMCVQKQGYCGTPQ